MATGWILDEMPLAKIIDHPVNHAVYGDNFDDELVKSIQENGVLEPLIVVKHSGGSYICLSGHRRKQAAKIAGLDVVPVRMFRGEMPEWEQKIILGEANRSRTKTTEQKARETKMLTEAYSERAKARMKAGKANPTSNLTEGSRTDREAISEAAAQTGIGSKNTAKAAIEVVDAIDAAQAAGDTEKAEDLRKTLNEKSVRAAHQKVKPPKKKKPAKDKPAVVAERDTPCQSLAANVEWVIKQVVPRTQEFAILAERMLGKKAGLFDVEAVKHSCKKIFDEFSRIEREVRVRAEAEKRTNA